MPSPVAFLEVTPAAGVLVLGKSLQLVGTPLDSNGAVVSDHKVQWSTPDSAIATVSSSGAVVGRVEGTASVIAISGGKAAIAKINVAKQPPAPVGSISIRLDDATLNVGQLAHATATTIDVNGQIVTGRSIRWSVDNSSVISAVSTAENKANVTGRGTGTAVLTATSEGQAASVTVNVAMAPVQKVVVNLASTTILSGQTTQATATLTDALGNVLTGRMVTWSSLDPSIATVSPVGVVTGIATGAVIIRATSEAQTGDGTETVGVAPVATVTVSLGSSTLAPGQTTQATAVARDANGNVLTGRSVSWTPLNPTVATVSTTGVVTAVAVGSATIQATVETKIGTAGLTVAPTVVVPVATVTVSLASSNLSAGQTTQASAVARDANGNVLTGRIVSWSPLNPSIATVSSSGLVSAVAAGSATIRATVETKTGDGALTVSAPVASVVVTFDSASIAVGHTTHGTAVAKDTHGNVLAGKTATWMSTDLGIATVESTTGSVTGVSSASVPIQATIEGVTGQKLLNVTPQSVISAPAPSSGTLASHNFDDGTLGPFYNPWGSGIDVVSDPTSRATGKVARIHYSTNGTTQVDDNKALLPQPGVVSIGLGQEMWFKGDFYIDPAARMNASGPSMVQRKLWRFGWSGISGSPVSTQLSSFGPQFLVTTLPAQAPDPTGKGTLSYYYLDPAVAALTAGAWHTLKVQIRLNSSIAASDGIFRIWYDGNIIFDRANIRWTDPTTSNDPSTYLMTNWSFGYQVDGSLPVDEYRYWDNVTFSTAPIP